MFRVPKEEDQGEMEIMCKAEPSLIYLISSQCEPRSRNWEATHQKCNNCKKHDDALCGPSYKKRDDPAVSELRNETTALDEHSVRDAEDQPRAPTPLSSRTVHTAGSVAKHLGQEHLLAYEKPNGKQKGTFAPDEPDELRKEADAL